MNAPLTTPHELRIPLVDDRYFVIREEAVAIDAAVVTVGVFSIHTGLAGEFRQRVSDTLTLRPADGRALLEALAVWSVR